MKPISVVLMMLMAIIAHPSQAGQCPAGSFPFVDNWGNKICKAFGSGETVTIERGLRGACPAGTFPTVDGWGNQVCKGFGKNAPSYYDTSSGCPAGSYIWTDSWGNRVCRSF